MAVMTRYTQSQRAFDTATLVVFATGELHDLARIARRLDNVAAVALALGAMALGLLGADLSSGVVHWFCDAWADPEWPLVGRTIVRTFRAHHEDPGAITRHGFVETNGANALIALVPMVWAWLLPIERGGALVVALGAFCAALALFVALTGQIHKWSHQPRPRWIVRVLHRTGFVLTPMHHARHHDQPFDRNYCITSGWLNPLLDGARFFKRLDRFFASRRPPSHTA
jgi:ubiquitin-conjugating enzyme E2 variant